MHKQIRKVVTRSQNGREFISVDDREPYIYVREKINASANKKLNTKNTNAKSMVSDG